MRYKNAAMIARSVVKNGVVPPFEQRESAASVKANLRSRLSAAAGATKQARRIFVTLRGGSGFAPGVVAKPLWCPHHGGLRASFANFARIET
jgi:hypothetical protein